MDTIVISNTHTNCATTVFIFGSISIKALDTEATCLLDSMIAEKQTVLIGDAFGVDKLVQQYLFEHNYQFVTVYFSGAKVRNNIGNWQTKQISNDNNLTGRSMYQLKDVAMAQDADNGLAIWDGKSRGTKFNIEAMIKLGKNVKIINTLK
jgi:PDZ domain-containing secreted protein